MVTLLPLLVITALVWGLLVAVPCAIVALTARLLLNSWRLWSRRHADAALPEDWWDQFEQQFRAYASRDWSAARRRERQG
jgi:hypothetical protein